MSTTDRFRLGDVVVHVEELTHVTKRPLRGQVVALAESGVGNWDDAPGYNISLAPGITRVGNNYDEWVAVPREQWTTLERVRSAEVTWVRPDWYRPGEEILEQDWAAFAVLRAMLTPAVEAEVFAENADWPYTIIELAERVAQDIDDRLAGARQLGAALARLGA